MLTFTNLIPIFLVFILYFLGMPIVYALFGSTFIYFLFINTTFPDGSVAYDTMEYPLADPAGKWYGKRTGRYVDTRYYFRRNARFPMAGIYHFAITNGMRDSAICGLKNIGFRVEYSNTK